MLCILLVPTCWRADLERIWVFPSSRPLAVIGAAHSPSSGHKVLTFSGVTGTREGTRRYYGILPPTTHS